MGMIGTDQVLRLHRAADLCRQVAEALATPVTLEPIGHATALETARRIRRLRHRRTAALGPLSGEPAWDILLEIFIAEQEGRKLTISGACFASEAPQTTALRHINALIEVGHLKRETQARAAKNVILSLRPQTSAAIRNLLSTP